MIQITHRYQMRDEIAQIVLYVYTPLDYEFATDNNTITYNAKNTAQEIKKYARENFSKTDNCMSTIIIDGVVIGSAPISKIKS